jgi:hypothetical protein
MFSSNSTIIEDCLYGWNGTITGNTYEIKVNFTDPMSLSHEKQDDMLIIKFWEFNRLEVIPIR